MCQRHNDFSDCTIHILLNVILERTRVKVKEEQAGFRPHTAIQNQLCSPQSLTNHQEIARTHKQPLFCVLLTLRKPLIRFLI